MRFVKSALLAVCLTAILNSWIHGTGDNPLIKAPNFVLEDKEGKTFALASMSGHDVILLFFRKELKKDAIQYADELTDWFRDRKNVRILLIADMRGLPSFITKEYAVKNAFKEKTSAPLLLDWQQKVNHLYQINPSRITLIMIDQSGHIKTRIPVGDYHLSNVRLLRDQLDVR